MCSTIQERVRAFVEQESRLLPKKEAAEGTEEEAGGPSTQLAKLAPDTELEALLAGADAPMPPPDEGVDLGQTGMFDVAADEEKVEELCKKAPSAPALQGKSEKLVKLTIDLLRDSLVGNSWRQFFPTPGRDPDLDNYADAFAARVAEMMNKALDKIKGKVITVVRLGRSACMWAGQGKNGCVGGIGFVLMKCMWLVVG
jgi:hypothetical protein